MQDDKFPLICIKGEFYSLNLAVGRSRSGADEWHTDYSCGLLGVTCYWILLISGKVASSLGTLLSYKDYTILLTLVEEVWEFSPSSSTSIFFVSLTLEDETKLHFELLFGTCIIVWILLKLNILMFCV